MAYSASALSFMLENLGKSIILTGSQVSYKESFQKAKLLNFLLLIFLQIPLDEQRNDAVNNLLGALIFASHYVIPEVRFLATK